jgi:2,3,4,5-tetrahydropyridine-2-carboxylate N-succinyltransferase
VSDVHDLAQRIERSWKAQAEGEPLDAEAVETAIGLLDRGEIRAAEPDGDGGWIVNQWVKQAVLLYFRVRGMTSTESGPFEYHDKLPLKHGYDDLDVRVVPPATARYGAFLSPGVVLMPSYVNIGAWVGPGTMVDTWATVGSCGQIGERVHLSGGVGIGGVLEPPQAAPVIVEDDAMIGSRSMITQGARVGEGSVLGEGVILNPAIPVIDAQTGEEVARGVVPPWCIVVQATRKREFPGGEFGLPCALILRRLEPGERADKAKLNEILREHGVAS